jgi:glycolate oxidase
MQLVFLQLGMYKRIFEDDIEVFRKIIGEAFVVTVKDEMQPYGKDYTEDLAFMPDCVLIPANANEISEILKYCNQYKIVITPRGGGTGLSGGALPHLGGVIISTKRMNKILSIDENNFQAIIEPGVINEELQIAVQKVGLFYPPDPASKGSCFIGGNVAHASGGPRALKYGTTRDYILNLQVVLPTGEIIWTGANTLKYSTGYNLTHLFIGSEGTLGIITQIVVKLIAHPTKNILLLASFENATQACEAVAGIFKAGCQPSVCEFVEPYAFELSSKFADLNFEIPSNIGAYLLIEADGFTDEEAMNQCILISEVLYQLHAADVLMADSTDKKEYFWKLRRTIGEATKNGNIYKEEDTVVPRATLPQLYNGVKQIGKKYNIRTVCYGHAGDGNLHVNILKDIHNDDYWNNEVKKAIIEIFELCKTLHGTISGEHGIGLVQKEFMPIVMPAIQLRIMEEIKKVFDPNNILNPGKIF